MSFGKISNFLDKFKKLTPPDYLIKVSLFEIVKSELGIELNKENIKVNNFVIFIKEKPIIKNEIYFKKEIILNKLNKELSIKIKDIK